MTRTITIDEWQKRYKPTRPPVHVSADPIFGDTAAAKDMVRQMFLEGRSKNLWTYISDPEGPRLVAGMQANDRLGFAVTMIPHGGPGSVTVEIPVEVDDA